MDNNYIAAIDFGTSKISTIVGELSVAGVKIIAYHETPLLTGGIKRSEIINIGRVKEAVKSCLMGIRGQIEDESYQIRDIFMGFSGKSLTCISHSDTITRLHSTEMITEREVQQWTDNMYHFENKSSEDVLLVIPQRYNIDENMGETDAVGMTGKNVEAFYKLFIGSKAAKESSIKITKELNLNCKGIFLNHIANSRAVLKENELELGTALLDIGSGTTKLIIIKNNIVQYASVIPFGGNNITSDISQVCKVSMADAELLKKRHGGCISEYAQENKVISVTDNNGNVYKKVNLRELHSVIEARISEILATAAYEIKESGYNDKLLSGVVLTGGTANLVNITPLAKSIFDKDVRLAAPNEDTIMSTSIPSVFRPECTTAVGLILKGVDMKNGESTPSTTIEEEYDTNLFGDRVTNQTSEKPSKPKVKRERKPLLTEIKSAFGGIFAASNGDDEA